MRDAFHAPDRGLINQLQQLPGVSAHACSFSTSRFNSRLYADLNIHYPRHLHTAASKRQAEYLAGRLCCQAVLADYQQADQTILSGHDRAPTWPPGLTGSISHCDNLAIALIAPVTHYTGLGVDCEQLHNKVITPAMRAMILTADESSLGLDHMPQSLRDLLVFSCKESIYKALYPQVRKFFDFQCARLTSLSDNRFSACLTTALSPSLGPHTQLHGHYLITNSHLITLLAY